MKHKLKIIGLGQNFEDIPPSYRKTILQAEVLIGGRRILDGFSSVKAKKIPITPPIDEFISIIKDFIGKNTVILADGDPLFFGIGQRLVKEFGKENLEFYPNVSVVQRAGSKLGISIRDIWVESLHGRKDIFPLLSAISWHRYVGVFTDNEYTPRTIAEIFIKRDIDEFQFHVFENLGLPDEKIGSFSVFEASKKEFSKLNFLILERIKPKEIEPYLGMEDHLFVRDRTQLTKKEIRILSIAQMKIEEESTIIDIGSGSGTISVESLVVAKKGRVFAIEKDPYRAEVIKKNRKRFGVYGLEIIKDRAENVLSTLPRADRIFIGGGLLNSPELLEIAYKNLLPGGRIVVNTVLVDTLLRCIDFCREKKIEFGLIEVNVNRGKELAGSVQFVPVNPVVIFTLFKESLIRNL